jgi:hypothetical protein
MGSYEGVFGTWETNLNASCEQLKHGQPEKLYREVLHTSRLHFLSNQVVKQDQASARKRHLPQATESTYRL